MMTICLGSGWRAAWQRPRLVLTLWLCNALVALAAGLGTSRWLGAAFDYSPEADKTLQRFHIGLLFELVQYDRFSPLIFLVGSVIGLLVLAAVLNPLVSAGILEVLATRDERPLLHRFFRGAGHFFGRYLRLLIISGIVFLVLAVLLLAVLSPVMNAVSDAGWERAWLAAAMGRLVLLGLLAALVMAIQDFARARAATADSEIRGMLRTWLAAARFVFTHLGTISAIYLAIGVIWLLSAIAGLAIVSSVPVTHWTGIWLLILLQQVFIAFRAGVRVARAGAGLEYLRRS